MENISKEMDGWLKEFLIKFFIFYFPHENENENENGFRMFYSWTTKGSQVNENMCSDVLYMYICISYKK